ncbi:MAG: LPS-assembly protein LptD, partial [Planctomycetota bacterium]
DGDEDRGLVRVPLDDRDTLRTWLRSRTRFDLGRDQWVDLVISDQSDPGVQSEFFERDYIDFEERETFVHWRRAEGANYASASAVTTLDEFQTQIEQLPEAEYVRQRTTLFGEDWAPLVYSSATKAGWYRRQEGDPNYEAPFLDGFGEASTWRFDSAHRFEVPLSVLGRGTKLTPFTEARWTGWSESGNTDDGPARTAVFAGAELSTTVWRRTAGGGIQELAPLVGWSTDAVFQETGGEPILIDQTELLTPGRFVDVGLRGRLRGIQLGTLPVDFDGEVRGRWGDGLEIGSGSGWLPLEVIGQIDTTIGSVPVRLFHDGRYDVDNGTTTYARTNLSFDPIPRMTIGSSFAVGRNFDGSRAFEAAFFSAGYRFTQKWEIEGTQTLDLDTNNSLNVGATIRRYGHDLIFELIARRRSGEGGSSVGFRLKPAITANRRPQVPTSTFGIGI